MGFALRRNLTLGPRRGAENEFTTSPREKVEQFNKNRSKAHRADGPAAMPQMPEGLLCYFSSRRPPTSSRIRICWMAISLSFRNRADCGMPSLIMTALMFSMFERQISWFTVA